MDRSKRYGDKICVCGPNTGYISPKEAEGFVEWCERNGIDQLCFMGGQGNLIEVMDEIYNRGFRDIEIVHLSDKEFNHRMFPAIRMAKAADKAAANNSLQPMARAEV